MKLEEGGEEIMPENLLGQCAQQFPLSELPIDGEVYHLSPDGEPKEGDREVGDLVMFEQWRVVTFFEVTTGGMEYVTSIKKFG